jgi:hypothetical protein
MESYYPIFGIFAALAAFVIGAGELIFLDIKPAAILTWLVGWMTSMSLVFSSSWPSFWAAAIAVLLTVIYFYSVFKLLEPKKE